LKELFDKYLDTFLQIVQKLNTAMIWGGKKKRFTLDINEIPLIYVSIMLIQWTSCHSAKKMWKKKHFASKKGRKFFKSVLLICDAYVQNTSLFLACWAGHERNTTFKVNRIYIPSYAFFVQELKPFISVQWRKLRILI